MTIALLAVIPFIIIFWYEVRRDGFDEEKSLDLLVLLFVVSVISSKIFYVISKGDISYNLLSANFSFTGAIFGLVFALYWFARKWKWSFYRISDIFVIALSLSMSMIFLTTAYFEKNVAFLVLSFWYFIFYFLLRRLRLTYSSGLAFSAFLIINPALIYFNQLQIYLSLITISLLNLYYRQKGIPMKPNLSKSFIAKTKRLLKRKEKELDAEQKRLIDSDPYMVEGRDEVDEYLDDTVEDITKRESDLKLALVKDVSIRVRKALARINIGKYGICDVCGEKIDTDRLKAYPEATTCVKHSS